MSQQQIEIINARFKTGLERLRFWLSLEPKASYKVLAELSGLKNDRVVANYICQRQLRKH